MPTKKVKDTKVGQWLREKAPSVLEVVGDALPDRGVLGVVKNLVDRDPTIDSASLHKIIDEEIALQDGVTRRWEEDASTDVRLTKLIRPWTLIAYSAFYMLITVADGVFEGFNPPEDYVSLLEMLMLTVFGAYFAGRTVEKIKR